MPLEREGEWDMDAEELDKEEHLQTDITSCHRRALKELWGLINATRASLMNLPPEKRVGGLEKLVKMHKDLVSIEREVEGLGSMPPVNPSIGIQIILPGKVAPTKWESLARSQLEAAKLPEGGQD